MHSLLFFRDGPAAKEEPLTSQISSALLWVLVFVACSDSSHVCVTPSVRMHWPSRLWGRYQTDNSKLGSNKLSLSLQGCTKGPHNKEKPPEPVKPEVKSSGEKKDIDDQKPKFNEYIISAPKPQEAIQRPRYASWNAVPFLLLFIIFFNETLNILVFNQTKTKQVIKISNQQSGTDETLYSYTF